MNKAAPWVGVLLVFLFLFSCAQKIVDLANPPDMQTLIEHQKRFEQRIEKVGDGVYCAVGYALANSSMIVVDGGKVVIDTTESLQSAKEIKEQFDAIAPGPYLAVIYTHTHPDHVLGASAFTDEKTRIWATDQAIPALNDQFASLGTILRKRGAKQFGEALPDNTKHSSGIGPFLRIDKGPVPPLLYPTDTFSGTKKVEIGGTVFELIQAPGETHDQLMVWIESKRMLFPGDNIYAAFPNLYSTRGVPPRPVRGWVASLDHMRALKPQHLVPSHTEPITGEKTIYEILTAYRDAIRFVHDSVIRQANQGYSPEDMVQNIKLPPHLAGHPYLQEFYGKVSWSVLGIYDGYLGWFDGNPTSLGRMHPKLRAEKLIPIMGGREKVLEQIDTAIKAEQMQWAAELADILLAVNPDDKQAKEAKAEALWWLGSREINLNARNYLMTSALELRGQYKEPAAPIINSETIKDVPVGVLIRTFPERIDYQKAVEANMSVAFELTDTGKSYVFVIRKGIGEVREGRIESPDLKFTAAESDFKAFLIGDLPPLKAISSGKIKAEGGLSKLLAFKAYLLKP